MKNILVQPNYIDIHPYSLSLNGEWQFDFADFEVSSIPNQYRYVTSLPKSVFNCVADAKILDSPYFSTNAKKYEWVDKKTWFFKKEFLLNDNKKYSHLFLCFDGCGYYSKIYINGNLLGNHEGLFGGPYVDIAPYVFWGKNNEIVVSIKAPNYIEKKKRKGKVDYGKEIMPWAINNDVLASSGDYVTFGIWKDIRLEFANDYHLARPFIYTKEIKDNNATISIECQVIDKKIRELVFRHNYAYGAFNMAFDNGYIGKTLKSDVNVKLEIFDNDKNLVFSSIDNVDKYLRRSCPYLSHNLLPYLYTKEVLIEKAKLWWTNGLGNQPLYNCKLSLLDNSNNLLDSLSINFAIRSLDFDYTLAKKLYNSREKYQFIINGKKIFIKGMNWCNDDILYNFDKEKIKYLLFSMKNLGVNLVRVWNGGNQFESDYFYNLCDSLGILVWQDLLLANNYDCKKWDNKVVDSQVSINVQRIRNHPSLAVYCGGNELNERLINVSSVFNTFRLALEENDWTRHFYITTPYGGSAHIYKNFDSTWYNKAYKDINFLAESGMASFPNYNNFREHFNDKKLLDRISLHNKQIEWFDELSFRMPVFENNFNNLVDRTDSAIINVEGLSLKSLFQFGNVLPSIHYQFMIESMRKQYPFTTGVLPWTFNRFWMSMASCMLIDSMGTPNMVYYAVKRAYSNYLLTLDLQKSLYLPNEIVPLKGKVICDNFTKNQVIATVKVYTKNGDILLEKNKKITINSYSTDVEFGTLKLPKNLINQYFYIRTILHDTKLLYDNTYILKTDNILLDKSFNKMYLNKFMPLEKVHGKRVLFKDDICENIANISVNILSKDEKHITIEIINGDTITYPVTIESESVGAKLICSDNYFIMYPKERKIIDIDNISNEKNISIYSWNLNKKIGVKV